MTNELHDPFLHWLPVEIVSDIFMNCLPFQPSLHVFESNFDERKHVHTLLTLGQVCQNWRHISRHSPELWTIFATTVTDATCVDSNQFAIEWLERSGGLDLFVRLDALRTTSYNEFSDKVKPWIALHAARWKVVDLGLPSFLLPFFSSLGGLDNLDHLQVTIADSDESISLELGASPLLLTLQDGYIPQISMNWSHLTHFTFISKHQILLLRECVFLFENASSLICCTLDEVFVNAEEVANAAETPAFCHPSLQNLLIKSCEPEFWDHFAFPSLTTVHIIHFNNSRTWRHVRDLLHRSGCDITDLHVYQDEDESQSELIRILKATPNLERLTIAGEASRRSFLSEMHIAFMSDASNFLRKLRVLSFISFYLPFMWTSLVNLLPTMSTPERGHSLQSVRIQYGGRPLEKGEDTIMDKKMFRCVVDATKDVKLSVVDVDGLDLMQRLRRHYNV